MLFLQGLYLNYIATRYRLYIRPTYFPAFIFVLLTSINPYFNYFSVPVLINWCVLIGLDISLSFNHRLIRAKTSLMPLLSLE